MMIPEKCVKPAFSVLGKEGSTLDGPDFIARLWAEANEHFSEIAPLAAKDQNGTLHGLWGAMSDMSRSFQPWEDEFTRGLYLAGVECIEGAVPPDGWTRWDVPGYEYLRVECTDADTFPELIRYLSENEIPLAGAVHDHTCPSNGKSYLYAPVRKL